MDQLLFEESKSQRRIEYINIYDIKGVWIFGAICVVYLFAAYYLQSIILTEQTYYNSLSGQVAEEEIAEMYKIKERMGILSYLLVPVTTFLKIFLPATCLYAAAILSSYTLSFRNAFKVALVAESAFVLATLLRLLLLAFFVDINTFGEIKQFAPLSLYSIFNASSIPSYLVYPLQVINVFEIIYCVLLATGLSGLLRKKFKPMLILALSGYGAGLFCWTILIAFLGVTSS